MRSLLAVVGALVLVLVVPLNAADPLRAFADDWKGVAVVLKKPLYTFGFARDAVGVLLRDYYPGQSGVTRTAPGQGVYYRYTATKPFAHTLVDTDVQRLARRARADAAYAGGGVLRADRAGRFDGPGATVHRGHHLRGGYGTDREEGHLRGGRGVGL